MNKIVLITGGSRGIGKATSLEIAKQGYFVCINYKGDKKSAENTVKEIKANGEEALAIKADISIEKDVLNLFKQIDSMNGILYGLVNNAGILNKQSPLVNMTYNRIKDTFHTNIIGSFLCAREAIKRMSLKCNGKGGKIINISSGASKFGSPNEYIDYASSKGAIDTFTIGLAKELAEDNIQVNAIRPGFIDTDIHQTYNRLESVKALIPMKRIGKPIEIANAVVWLLSDKSSYTTGAIIDIAGGK